MPMLPTTTTARRVFPMDLPPAILDAIRHDPDHEAHWLCDGHAVEDQQ